MALNLMIKEGSRAGSVVGAQTTGAEDPQLKAACARIVLNTLSHFPTRNGHMTFFWN